MKFLLRKIIVLLSLLSIITIKVDAKELAPANVQLLGNADGLVHIPGDDLFLHYPNMMPGDRISRTLEIKNDYEYSYELFIRAERVSPEEEYDLLNKLDLKIIYEDKVIYAGPTSGEKKLTDNISLGVFRPGQEEELFASVVLDGPSTGNQYKNKYAKVDWIFTAIRNEDGVDPPVNPTTQPPQTGDKGILQYTLLGGASILILLMSRNNYSREGDKLQ